MTDLSEVPMNTIIPECARQVDPVQNCHGLPVHGSAGQVVCVDKPVSFCQQVSMCLSPFDQRLSPPQWAPPTHTHTLNPTLGNTSSCLTHTHTLPGAWREGCSICPSVHLCFGYQGVLCMISSSEVSAPLLPKYKLIGNRNRKWDLFNLSIVSTRPQLA